MSKINELLLGKNIIDEKDIYTIFTMGKSNVILEGGIYTQQIVVLKEDGLSFTRFFGRGLVKRIYHFGSEIKLSFEEITKVNFERRNGYVWLDMFVGEKSVSLSLTRRDWKKPETKALIEQIKSKIVIGNYDIFTKLNNV